MSISPFWFWLTLKKRSGESRMRESRRTMKQQTKEMVKTPILNDFGFLVISLIR